MRKFTIFTIILTIIVLVIAAEVIVDEYVPVTAEEDVAGDFPLPETLDLSKTMETNVLGSDLDYSKIPEVETESGGSGFDLVYENISLDEGQELEKPSPSAPIYNASTGDEPDFEDENYSDISHDVYLRDDQIRSAGFVGAYLQSEPHNGFLFKTIYIDDLYDVEVSKTSIKTDESLLAKVYVIKVGSLTSVNEVYEVLKVRGSEGLDVDLNETNEFGDGSFYLNDARRSNVAFLTAKVGGLIYGISYPKEYHAQVKNLLMLIDYEF